MEFLFLGEVGIKHTVLHLLSAVALPQRVGLSLALLDMYTLLSSPSMIALGMQWIVVLLTGFL